MGRVDSDTKKAPLRYHIGAQVTYIEGKGEFDIGWSRVYSLE